MKKHPYISIYVRLACLSHKRQKPPVKRLNELRKKAPGTCITKAVA